MLNFVMGGLYRRLKGGDERGQALILMVFGMTVIFLMAAVVIDVSLWLSERRRVQRAADLAVLAGVQDLPGDDALAILHSQEWAAKNGYEDGTGGVVVSAETLCKNSDADTPLGLCVNGGGPAPSQCAGVGCDSLRVVISKPADLLFASIFSITSFDIEAVASAVCAGCSTTSSPGASLAQHFVDVPASLDCSAGSPVVDGRALVAVEGYAKLGDVVSTSTSVDYGDALAACDSDYYYFALRLNGPRTGGAVANENVYGGCVVASPVQVNGGIVGGLAGRVTALGAASFTLDTGAAIWTVDVDAGTSYTGLDAYGDLAANFAVEVEGALAAPQVVLATNVERRNEAFCTASSSPTYHANYITGWSGGAHTFQDLLEGDRARFQISCDGVAIHDFVQDYLRWSGSEWLSDTGGDGTLVGAGPNQSASSLEWNLENSIATGWGDVLGENQFEHAPPFDTLYPDYAPQYGAYVSETTYEFRVPLAAYAGCGAIVFGLEDIGGAPGPLSGIHNSPVKANDGADLAVVAAQLQLVE